MLPVLADWLVLFFTQTENFIGRISVEAGPIILIKQYDSESLCPTVLSAIASVK